MAQYEQETTAVVESVQNSGLNSVTSQAIVNLVSSETNVKAESYTGGPVTEGTQVLTVGADQTVTDDPGTPVIIFDAASPGANLNLAADEGQDRVVVAGGGDDNIVVTGNGNVTVETGGGNDTVETGGGNDQVAVTGDGESSVTTGEGTDVVTVTGAGSVTVDAGSGNDQIILSSDSANVTVDGGEGFDQVSMDDNRDNHTFTYEDGVLVLNSSPTQISNVQVVEFNNGISVIAENAAQAAVARLYEVLFDREADLGGLEFWMNRVDEGASLEDIAQAFITSEEFQSDFGEGTVDDFINHIYQSMAGRDADAEGFAYWKGQMEDGLSQADVAWDFATSDEAINLMGINGTQYIIDLA